MYQTLNIQSNFLCDTFFVDNFNLMIDIDISSIFDV